jgi:ankyrin repeat protein
MATSQLSLYDTTKQIVDAMNNDDVSDTDTEKMIDKAPKGCFNIILNDGSCIIFAAIRRYDEENCDMLRKVIQLGADVNINNSKGDTPLKVAIKNERYTPVAVLLNAGATLTTEVFRDVLLAHLMEHPPALALFDCLQEKQRLKLHETEQKLCNALEMIHGANTA